MIIFVNVNIQNSNEVELQGFDLGPYLGLIQSDPGGFFGFLDDLAKRKHTISKSGVVLERQLLFTWKKNGLLPFRTKVDANKKTWNRFSFMELSWLKVLIALRKQGVAIDRLKKIKEGLFPDNFLTEVISVAPFDQLLGTDTALSGLLREKGISNANDLKNVEIDSDLLEETQFSLFFCILFSSIIMRANMVIYIDQEATPGVVNLDGMRSSPITGVVDAYDILSKPSIITINISAIVIELAKSVDFSSKWLIGFRLK